jgi:hypothetical protein
MDKMRSVFETQQKKVLGKFGTKGFYHQGILIGLPTVARQAAENGRLDDTGAALNLQRCVERIRREGSEAVICEQRHAVF